MARFTSLFGNPPFSFLAGQLAQDDDFLADAKIVLGLEQPEYLRLVAQLNKSDEFLSRPAIKAVVSEASATTKIEKIGVYHWPFRHNSARRGYGGGKGHGKTG